jgi:hypothetical protein
VLFLGLLLEGVPTHLRVRPAQGSYVRAVAYLIEPLEHARPLFSHRLPHLLERKLDLVDLASGDSRQGLGHVLPRELVRRYVHAPACELLTVLQNHRREGRYVGERDLLPRDLDRPGAALAGVLEEVNE